MLREVSLRGTLAAAAQALGYNPSSVSHQLRLLEDDVGVPLLEPVGRCVRLTEEAAILIRHPEGILRHLESAEAEIALSRSSVRGTVRLASFQTAAHTVVPPALLRLREDHPDLHVSVAHIAVELALPALLARDFDLVLQEDYPGRPRPALEGAEVTGIGLDPLWLLTPAGDPATRLEDLADRAWVMEPPETQAGGWAQAACRGCGVRDEGRVRVLRRAAAHPPRSGKDVTPHRWDVTPQRWEMTSHRWDVTPHPPFTRRSIPSTAFS